MIAAAAASGSRFSVRGSMSANTGRAPLVERRVRRGHERERRGDDLVALARPRPRASRGAAPPSRSDTALAWRRADPRGERRLEGRHPRAERELARAQHLDAPPAPRPRRAPAARAGSTLCVTPAPVSAVPRCPARGAGAPARGSIPASSESTSASQLASMMFSCTPIAPQLSRAVGGVEQHARGRAGAPSPRRGCGPCS